MSSPRLLIAQMNRSLRQGHEKRQGAGIAVDDMRKEVLKLKEQEDRYNKAYGAGLFLMEKLKEYVVPIRERVVAIENQIAEVESKREHVSGAVLPEPHEVEVFAKRAADALQGLNFGARRAIVMDVVERVTGTQSELKVSGHIPIQNLNYGELQTVHSNCWATKCGEIHALQSAHEAECVGGELSFCDDRPECGRRRGA